MSGVTLKNAIKRYGDVEVIHGVDLEIENGEFCVFVGPSGCGKSTLLRMIAGLEDTSEGQIKIGTRDVTRRPADRSVAMVFQTYALSAYERRRKYGFGLKMNGVAKGQFARKSKSRRHPAAWPLPETQTCCLAVSANAAIGRAIVRGPEVFLFDEPSNLDAELVDMRKSPAFTKKLQITIYVTHDQVEAMTLADKIVVLRAGKIEQIGNPMALYQDPDNKFVAGFIGSPSMNFLQGTVQDGKVSIPALNDKKILTDVTLPRDSDQVIVGVRPNHLKITRAQSPIKVDIHERLGGIAYDYLTAATGERLVAETRGDDPIQSGSTVMVDFSDSDALFFDAKTEERLR